MKYLLAILLQSRTYLEVGSVGLDPLPKIESFRQNYCFSTFRSKTNYS